MDSVIGELDKVGVADVGAVVTEPHVVEISVPGNDSEVGVLLSVSELEVDAGPVIVPDVGVTLLQVEDVAMPAVPVL